MKKKVLPKKSIVGAAATIFLGGCSADHSEYNMGSRYDDLLLNSNSEKGKHLLNINELRLSAEIERYANIMNLLIKDITTDESASKQFCSDPDTYLSQKKYSAIYGVNISQYLNQKDKMVLLAMADKEVLDAAKNKNLSEFIRLCRLKGLISDSAKIVSNGYADYKKFFKTEEDYQLFLKSLPHSEQMMLKSGAVEESIYMGIAIGAKIAAITHDYILDQFHTCGETELPEMPTEVLSVMHDEPILKFWANEHSDTYIPAELLYDELVLTRADELTNAIIENYSHYDREKIREFIALNLQNFYNLENKL